MNLSFFVVDSIFFSQLLIDNFGDTWQISCWRQKLMVRKVVNYIWPRLSTALHQVTITKKNFHLSGVFWTTGGMGPGDFWQSKKRKHQLFKQQTLLPLYHSHAIILLAKGLVRTLVFCCIGYTKSKCRPIEWNQIEILILLGHWCFICRLKPYRRLGFLTGSCLTETLFPEMYSTIGTVLGEHSWNR